MNDAGLRQAPFTSRRRTALWLGGLLFAVVCARLAGVWFYRHDINPDGAVVHLMVRHVLAGEPWPVFFYGQAYMGSFEPLVSALLAWPFGLSPAVIGCGPAALGVAMVLGVGYWAWRAAGWRAAVPAMAVLMIGPPAYLHYLAVPRGGYAALLAFTVSTLAGGAILLVREAAGRPARWPAYLLLGVGAGLGFWSHYLTLPAAAAVAVAFLAWRRGGAFRVRILAPVVAGFLLGSLPLWIWNARHDWASLAMSGSVGLSPRGALHSLRLLVGPRLQELLGVSGAARGLRWTAILVHALLVLPVWSAWGFRRPAVAGAIAAGPDRQVLRLHLTVAAAYLVFFGACFAASPQYTAFRTPRYLLPLVPVAAWLAGVGCACAARRWLRVVAWTAVVLAVASQLALLPHTFRFSRSAAEKSRRLRHIGQVLQDRGITAAYASYLLYSINPLSDEAVCCSDPKLERYAPYAERIERDPSPAVLENLGDVAAWVPATGGQVTYLPLDGVRIHCDFRPPVGALREVPPESIARVCDGDGADLGDALGDRRLATGFGDLHPTDEPGEVVFSFTTAVHVAAVRLWGVDEPPAWWEVEGRAGPDEPFRLLSHRVGETGFFWSGPRIYWGGPQHRHEYRFTPAAVRELRVRFGKSALRAVYRIPEIQLLAADPAADERPDPELAPLLALLNARGITHLYADRWIANQVQARTGGAIWTSRAPRGPTARAGFAADGSLQLGSHTAVLLPAAGAPSLRAAAAVRGLVFDETRVPGFGTLFEAGRPAGAVAVPADPGIRIAGAYALLVRDAEWVQASLAAHAGAWSREELEQRLELAPDCVPAMRALTNLLTAAGAVSDARVAAQRLDLLVSPRVAGPASFSPGMVWTGCTPSVDRLPPDTTFSLTHLWYGDLRATAGYKVFVHFVGPGGYRFQDDHSLPESPVEAGTTSSDAPVLVTRRVHVPADAPAGRYELRLGLYRDGAPDRRLKVRTPRHVRQRALTIPDVLEILPPTRSTP